MVSFYFYLARCSNNALYAGSTSNLTEREQKHNAGTGAKYTRAHGPITIVYSEEFSTRSEALKREAEVKKWKKTRKEALLTTSS